MTDRDERLLQAFLDDLGSAPVPVGLARQVARRIGDEHPARASRFAAWFMPVAAALTLMALLGFAVIAGGPKPSPSVPPVPPSASPSASPSAPDSSPASPSPSSTPFPPPTVMPDSSAAPSPSASAPAFHVTLDPGGNMLPVLVSDSSATVTAAAPGRPGPGTSDPVAVVQGPDPKQLVVRWAGGACDLLSQVTIDAARTTISVSTLTTNQGCDAIGIDRAVVLTFGQPVAASSIKGQRGLPLSPGMVALTPSAVAFTDAKHGFVAGADAFIGIAYLAETSDGVGWQPTPIGWGTVTGLAVTVDATVSAHALVSISCSAGGDPPDPGCVSGIYQGPGPIWRRLSDTDAVALAARGSAIAALTVGPTLPTASYPFPPRGVALSADAGKTWRTVDSPCPSLWATGIALDGEQRPLVVCEGSAGTGEAGKTMFRATDPSATRWTKLPAPPNGGTGFQLSLAADATGLMWGPRSPLLVTADGGATWTPNAIADGNARMVEDASALPGGGAVILVWDPDQRHILVLRTSDAGANWTQLSYFPPFPG